MTQSFLGKIPVPILLGITMFFWGAAFNATDIAFEYTTAGVITLARPVIATLILLPLLPLLGGKLPRSPKIWLFAVIVGVGSTTMSLTGLGVGTMYAGPAIAAVLLNSAPFFAVLIARATLRERITILRATGLLIGFAGVVIIVLSNPIEVGSGNEFVIGVVAVMLGAIGYAASSVFVRWMSIKKVETDLWGFTTAQFICGAVFIIPFTLLQGDPGATLWGEPGLWASLAFLGIGSQLIAYVCFFVALARWPSGRVMAWSFLPPVVAGVIEIFRGNIPGAITLIGMGITIIGVAVVNHPKAEAIPLPSLDPEEHIA